MSFYFHVVFGMLQSTK